MMTTYLTESDFASPICPPSSAFSDANRVSSSPMGNRHRRRYNSNSPRAKQQHQSSWKNSPLMTKKSIRTLTKNVKSRSDADLSQPQQQLIISMLVPVLPTAMEQPKASDTNENDDDRSIDLAMQQPEQQQTPPSSPRTVPVFEEKEFTVLQGHVSGLTTLHGDFDCDYDTDSDSDAEQASEKVEEEEDSVVWFEDTPTDDEEDAGQAVYEQDDDNVYYAVRLVNEKMEEEEYDLPVISPATGRQHRFLPTRNYQPPQHRAYSSYRPYHEAPDRRFVSPQISESSPFEGGVESVLKAVVSPKLRKTQLGSSHNQNSSNNYGENENQLLQRPCMPSNEKGLKREAEKDESCLPLCAVKEDEATAPSTSPLPPTATKLDSSSKLAAVETQLCNNRNLSAEPPSDGANKRPNEKCRFAVSGDFASGHKNWTSPMIMIVPRNDYDMKKSVCSNHSKDDEAGQGPYQPHPIEEPEDNVDEGKQDDDGEELTEAPTESEWDGETQQQLVFIRAVSRDDEYDTLNQSQGSLPQQESSKSIRLADKLATPQDDEHPTLDVAKLVPDSPRKKKNKAALAKMCLPTPIAEKEEAASTADDVPDIDVLLKASPRRKKKAIFSDDMASIRKSNRLHTTEQDQLHDESFGQNHLPPQPSPAELSTHECSFNCARRRSLSYKPGEGRDVPDKTFIETKTQYVPVLIGRNAIASKSSPQPVTRQSTSQGHVSSIPGSRRLSMPMSAKYSEGIASNLKPRGRVVSNGFVQPKAVASPTSPSTRVKQQPQQNLLFHRRLEPAAARFRSATRRSVAYKPGQRSIPTSGEQIKHQNIELGQRGN